MKKKKHQSVTNEMKTATYKIVAQEFDEETNKRRVIRIVKLVESLDDRELLKQLRGWDGMMLREIYAIIKISE